MHDVEMDFLHGGISGGARRSRRFTSRMAAREIFSTHSEIRALKRAEARAPHLP
jgi:hypothetical protein